MATTTTKKTMKIVFFTTIAMAMTIALSTLISIGYQEQNDPTQVISDNIDQNNNNNNNNNKPIIQLLPSKRVNRFLVESSGYNHLLHGRSLKPADHCHKDYEVCSLLGYGANFTCCGNKCFDLTSEKAHCGACHNKCKFTTSCCKGKCVDINYDKRNCGGCGQKCLPGQFCVYGMCDYA